MRPQQLPPAAGSAANRSNRPRRRTDLTLPVPQRDPALAVPLPLPPTSAASSSASSSLELKYSDLERVSRIGSGAGGTVYKVLHRPTGKIYALKVIYGNHEDSVRNQMLREIKIIRDVDNPNVVRCHNLITDNNGEIQVLLEYMDKGSLEGKHIPREPQLSDLTRQILCGLSYLHRRKIVHRDIKPANLLIDSRGIVKIADFGVSRVLAQTMDCNSSVGTIAYMSPERINTDINHGQYDGYAGDIWSLGVSILEFYLGNFPFSVGRAGDWASLMCAICLSQPPEAPEYASKEFRDFIACCLQRDPVRRWTAAQLLKHPFITQYASPGSNGSRSNQVHQSHQILPPPRFQFS